MIMKRVILGIIILATMGSAAVSFTSCSGGRNRKEAELDDSTKTAMEMEALKMQEPEFEMVTSHGTM